MSAEETTGPAPTTDDLVAAEHDVLASIERYVALAAQVHPEGEDVVYAPAGRNEGKYDPRDVNIDSRMGGDQIFNQALSSSSPRLHALLLSQSPHWQDRIRAQAIANHRRNAITMPDGFPCIYEPASSPRNANHLYPSNFIWVASPDEEMLRELLPVYRELWEAYESQWPSSPKRTFEIGHLDGVPTHGIYRPGTTVREVIGQTMLVHSDMYRRAPEHIQAMHPSHESWQEDRRRHQAALLAINPDSVATDA